MRDRRFWIVLLGITLTLAACGEVRVYPRTVRQLAFTRDGRHLVVARSVPPDGAARGGHCRLQSYTTTDWMIVADTGKLVNEGFQQFAASAGKVWVFQGAKVNRGGGNPYLGILFQTFDPVKLQREDLELLGPTDDKKQFFCDVIASNGKIGVVRITRGGRRPASVFAFDLKEPQKHIDLEDFPTKDYEPPPPYSPKTAYSAKAVMHTLLEVAPDGGHVASSHPCTPYRIQLHAAATGKLTKSLPLESSPGAMQFSPDGKMLAVFCWNGQVHILAPDLSKAIHTLEVKGYQVFPRAVAFVGNDYLAVLSRGNEIQVFDTEKWLPVRRFEGKNDQVKSIAGSPTRNLLAAGFGQSKGAAGMVRVWDVTTGKLAVELK